MSNAFILNPLLVPCKQQQPRRSASTAEQFCNPAHPRLSPPPHYTRQAARTQRCTPSANLNVRRNANTNGEPDRPSVLHANDTTTTPFDEAPYIVDIADEEEEESSEEEEAEDGNVIDVKGATQRRKKVRAKTRALLSQITTQPKKDTVFAADADAQPPLEDDVTVPFIRTVVKSADERKGVDIVALRVSKLTYITSFIVLVSGNNAPQLRAIANLIEENLTKVHQLEPTRIDGVPNSGWILLDYGDFLVNVFSPEQRKNYALETLWRRGEVLDVSDWLVGQPETTPEASVDALDDWLGDA